jgi:hypothetical protein
MDGKKGGAKFDSQIYDDSNEYLAHIPDESDEQQQNANSLSKTNKKLSGYTGNARMIEEMK